MRRSCSDSLLTASQSDGVFGSDTGRAPSWRERARLIFTAKQYRAKAAEYTELLKTASLPAETGEFRKLEQSYLTLAESEEWMSDNLEKTNSPGADENWYRDAILAQQGKHTLTKDSCCR